MPKLDTPDLTPDLFGWLLYDGKETLAGVVLIVLQLFFLTGPPRRKIRWAVLYLALYIILMGLRLLFPPETAIRTTIKFTALFLLFSSLGLGVFLLVPSSRLTQTFIRPLPK